MSTYPNERELQNLFQKHLPSESTPAQTLARLQQQVQAEIVQSQDLSKRNKKSNTIGIQQELFEKLILNLHLKEFKLWYPKFEFGRDLMQIYKI